MNRLRTSGVVPAGREARSGGRSRSVDVHQHLWPRALIAALRARRRPPRLRGWTLELAGEPDDIDEMLSEIETRVNEEEAARERGQLELFGGLLSDLAGQKMSDTLEHRIMLNDGRMYAGSWDRIVRAMRDANKAMTGRSVQEFMATEASRGYSITGVKIPIGDAESFIRGSANAGLLRIVR